MQIAARTGMWAKSGLTARDYVQDGLIAMFDGIDNAGYGMHNPNATTWRNLADSSNSITLLNDAYFDANSLVTDSSFRASGQIASLIPWPSIKHAEYLANVRGAPGTTRDRFCSLATTFPSAGYDMNARIFGWNNNLSQYGLMVKFNSVNRTGVRKVPNGLHSYSIGYGDLSPATAAPVSFYEFGMPKSLSWSTDGSAGQDGLIGGSAGTGIYCNFHAIRYYNRVLTAAEVARNYEIDRLRFRPYKRELAYLESHGTEWIDTGIHMAT